MGKSQTISQQEFDEFRVEATEYLEKVTAEPQKKLDELVKVQRQNQDCIDSFSIAQKELENRNEGFLWLYKTADQKERIAVGQAHLSELKQSDVNYRAEIDKLSNDIAQIKKEFNLEGQIAEIHKANPDLVIDRPLNEIRQEVMQQRFHDAHANLVAQQNMTSQELSAKLEREEHALDMARLARAAYEEIDTDKQTTEKNTPTGWGDISHNAEVLDKYGLDLTYFPNDDDFHARFFIPDPNIVGEKSNDLKPVIVFRGTNSLNDWESNILQSIGYESSHYNKALAIAQAINESGNSQNIKFVGHSLGGGLAASAALLSGADAITFNAAGVHKETVERLGEIQPANIEAYHVKGELLTRMQKFGEIDLYTSLAEIGISAITSNIIPSAPATSSYTLPRQTTDNFIAIKNALADHGMDKVIQALKGEIDQSKEILQQKNYSQSQTVSQGVKL